MTEDIKRLPVMMTLKTAYERLNQTQNVWRVFWLVNFAFCAVFNLLPKGFANPFSLVWSVGYYVFWCVFFRVCYQKKPYLMWQKVVASAVPSSKMIFITFVLLVFLLFLPYIPLMLGFKGQYLLYFERYMAMLQAPEISLFNVAVFSVIFLLCAPIAFCRPYLAFISAVQGLSGSVRKIFKKTQGNYLPFLALMIALNLPCLLVYELDTLLMCHGWFQVGFYSIYLIYFNIVFATVYNTFYDIK